jgi:ketosteroid isomerase-like protein
MGPIELAERLYEAVVQDDSVPFLALCADDVVIDYPGKGLLPYGGTWNGRDGARAFLDAHDATEEILAFDVGQIVADGDSVLALGNFEGRSKATNELWSTSFVHVLTFEAGLLTRWQAYFDSSAAVEAHRAN